MMVFSGLRGAIAFALAIRNTLTESRQLILSTTLIIVIVTVIFNGGMTISVLSWLKIPTGKKTCYSWMINGDKLRVSIKDFFSSDSQRYPFSDQHFFDFDYLCCINSHILLLKEPYWESFNFIHFAETKVYWV